MKKILIILILTFGMVSTADCKTKKYNDIHNVEVTSVYDGDTIKVNLPCNIPIICRSISIRVNGIDTPEIKGKCKEEKILAIRAKEMVKNAMMAAQTITLKNIKRGKYFRIVADVFIKDKYNSNRNINELLIKSKLAVPYEGGTKTHNWCK